MNSTSNRDTPCEKKIVPSDEEDTATEAYSSFYNFNCGQPNSILSRKVATVKHNFLGDMETIRQQIPLSATFKKYTYTFEDEKGCRISRIFIVLVRNDGYFRFTDFHRYVRNPREKTCKLSQHGESRFDYIIPFLNFAFSTQGIHCLEELNVDIIQAYLTHYSVGRDKTVRKSTVERCISYLMDFVQLLLEDEKNHLSFQKSDLYKEIPKRDKRGKIFPAIVPCFSVPVITEPRVPLNRDIPQKAFFILLDHIVRNHTDLLGIIIASAFAGCRTSESCNLRCPNSPLGPGILFTFVNGEIVKIQLDLTREVTLRSDAVNVGRIKKERIQNVPQLFLKPFMALYEIYENYISTVENGRDPQYMPFSINSQGNAMTYDCFYNRFRDVVQELIPIFMSSDDPEIAIYGKTLIDHPITPHIFRHYYTVQLVLSGISEPGELMSLRGDSCPESALTYLQNKGELEKQFTLVNDSTFDYLAWAAEKKHKRQGGK